MLLAQALTWRHLGRGECSPPRCKKSEIENEKFLDWEWKQKVENPVYNQVSIFLDYGSIRLMAYSRRF